MVLRKPYALFIKLFKPIHLVLSILLAYLITIQNKVMSIFNEYIYSDVTVIGKVEISGLIKIIPIFVLAVFAVILGIMYKKNKPYKFYIIGILLFLAIIIINVYSLNAIKTLQEQALAIKNVKFMHDMSLVNIITESVVLIFLIIRGMGIDIKSFDFSSDLSKIDISESDREEYEVSINLDSSELRRKNKKRLRNIKYLYYENKFLFNVIAGAIVLVVAGIITIAVLEASKQKKEGFVHSISGVTYYVVDTMIIDEDYNGNKITENKLIVVELNIKSAFNKSIYLKDFDLNISGVSFDPTVKYSKYLIDIGKTYNEDILLNEYSKYLVVFEVPEKYLNDKMLFKYVSEGNATMTKLNPKQGKFEESKETININNVLSFEKTLGNISFKINSFDVASKYKIEYNYCMNDKSCIPSIEYLKPKIDENFDKTILKLDVEYTNKSGLSLNKFYDLFEKFGSIQFSLNGKTYIQKGNFEEINSLKKSVKGNVYIGVDSRVEKADKIKLIFKIRKNVYEYILK